MEQLDFAVRDTGSFGLASLGPAPTHPDKDSPSRLKGLRKRLTMGGCEKINADVYTRINQICMSLSLLVSETEHDNTVVEGDET